MRRAILASALALMSSGCLGTGALNAQVRDFNLEVVENRYGREAIFFTLNVIWIYRICTVLDLFIFNSLEFWTGKNFINGRNALADIPLSAAEKISLREVDRAQVEWVSENEARLIVDFLNGDHLTFDVTRDRDTYTVSYLGRVFFTGQIDASSPVGEQPS